jgi:calcium-dependent protein kinase
MNAKSRSNRQIADLSDIVERKKERLKTNKLHEIKKVIFEKSERSQTPNNDNKDKEKDKNDKFKRRSKKSTTLVEKSRMESKFKEEMKLNVKTQTLIEEQKGDPSKKYKVVKRLGDGSYGTVFSVVNIQTGATVAMKKIEKVKENEIDDLEIKNEIDILKKLDHPNIVKIYEFYNTLTDFYIVTEYCKKGELYSYIKRSYTENQLAVLFYQIFSGLYYLHTNNIVHRDLKLENILISEIEKDMKTGKKYFWTKIIDFGTAKIFEKNKNEKAVVGSSYYIAPEVLFKNYNEKCDTWSAGVILYMLIVGRAPFDGADDEEIIENIKKGKFNTKHKKLVATSPEVQDLVKKLLEVNVGKRLSAAEALKHPWFKKFDAKSLYKNISDDKIKMYLSRLRKYEINSKFQQMVLAFIVHNLPDSVETKEILKIFRIFNTNDDGKLTKKDIYNGLIKYFDKKEIDDTIDDIFLLLDGANRGFIEYEEFMRATIDPKIVLSDENLVYAFNFFDRDNTGRISVEKIMSIFVDDKVNEEVFRSIFNEIDTNQDGEIDYQEFKDMMLGN